MALKISNNATTTLAGSLTSGATTVSVAPGTGALFPALGAGDWFPITLTKVVAGQPVYEVMRATARVNDNLTVTRAQEGTSATEFSAGDRVDLRLSALAIQGFARKDEPNTFTAPITLSGAPTDPLNAANKDYVDNNGTSLASIHAALLSFY